MKKHSIALGSDHAGFEKKQVLLNMLTQGGYTVKDLGAVSTDSYDYPDAAHPVAQAIESGMYDLGILICGTGNGMAIAANKHQGIRAGLAWTEEIARLIRLHNDANVLCMPARFMDNDLMLRMVEAFLTSDFEGGRHEVRKAKIPLT